MKKNKTYTVTQLNKIAREERTLDEMIEMCSFSDIFGCHEPMEVPPKEQEDEWRRMRGEYEPEQTLENSSFYVTEPDGTRYFYCGNTRIKVTEYFAEKGKTVSELVEDVVRYAARNGTTAKTSPIC